MGVPSIFATEAVYVDGDTAQWVTCELEWDGETETFVNREADSDWQLVDWAMDDATYTVDDATYGDIQRAIRAALDRGLAITLVDPSDVSVRFAPASERTPEWGPIID